MMNTDHLGTFLAVCRHRNYTRAARELHLSQSAVWRQVRQLEMDLGAPLMEQLGKELHLTDAGRALVAEAETLLGQTSRLKELVRGFVQQVQGRLRIGASTTPGYWVLPPVLGAFVERHGDVDVRYEVENSAVIERRLVCNEIDVGFVGGALSSDALHAESWFQDEIVCFAAPAHPLAMRRRIAPQTLAATPCVMREEGSATRRLFESWLADRGVRLGRTLVLRCPEALKAMVRAGVGFGFLSVSGIADETRQGTLRRLPVTGLRLHRPITVAWHAQKHLSPPMQAFLDLCRDAPSPR